VTLKNRAALYTLACFMGYDRIGLPWYTRGLAVARMCDRFNGVKYG
jgi:hypothetical protein